MEQVLDIYTDLLLRNMIYFLCVKFKFDTHSIRYRAKKTYLCYALENLEK